MISDEIEYELFGDDMQVVEIELDPNETVIAEAGAMSWMEDDIEFEAKLGDGSEANSGFFGNLFSASSRVLSGESLFMTHFTNSSKSHKRRVAFSSPFPGKIIPIDLKDVDGSLYCQKDAFLCAAKGTKIEVGVHKRFGAGLFGGEGFLLQKISGDGLVFIQAGGHIVEKSIKIGEKLRVDTGCIVAYDGNIDFDIQRAGNLKSMLFGGEGLFLATLTGEGTVFLQSLPFSRLANRVLANSPTKQVQLDMNS
jgi:uncharacterized protein (TIGR00266 family)